MKRLLTTIILLALAVPAFSQGTETGRWTVRASAAYYPTVPFVALPWLGLGMGLSADKDAGETSKIDFPPYVSVEALYRFSTRWSVGLNIGYCGLSGKVYNGDGSVKSSSDLVLIPITLVGRFNYLDRQAVKLYGSLEAGTMLSPDTDSDAIFNFQLNPIGIEFGRRLFGLTEIGIGLNYVGVRAGLGYRF